MHNVLRANENAHLTTGMTCFGQGSSQGAECAFHCIGLSDFATDEHTFPHKSSHNCIDRTMVCSMRSVPLLHFTAGKHPYVPLFGRNEGCTCHDITGNGSQQGCLAASAGSEQTTYFTV